MNKHKQILRLIKEIRESHSEMVNIFTMGSCINLYCILKVIYLDAVAYTNSDHIITKIDDKFYDITGEISDVGYLPFFEIYAKKEKTLKTFYDMYKNQFKIK